CAPTLPVATARAGFAVTQTRGPDTGGGTTLSDGQGALSCEPGSAADTVLLFTEKFNAGDTSELARLIAGPGTFLMRQIPQLSVFFRESARVDTSLVGGSSSLVTSEGMTS